MDAFVPQKVLLASGSFSGLRPLGELGSSYLAQGRFRQPLCGNDEGWGPLSPYRWDFTPCFIDVWIATVSVYGLLLGSFAVWWLVKKTEKTLSDRKNAHFWIKQVRWIPYHNRGARGRLD